MKITDDEFEALLDQLHGKGQFAGAPAEDETTKADTDTSGGSEKSAGDADLISDDEFENLLDELHGKGAGPSAGAVAGEPKPSPAPSSKAEPAPEPKKAEAKAESKAAAKPAPAPAPAREAAPAGETTVRVDTKRLDDILNWLGYTI